MVSKLPLPPTNNEVINKINEVIDNLGGSTESFIPYGESDSAADATQKEVTISSITSLSAGQIIIVKPTITSTVADSTLKLNDFAAYPMRYGAAAITTSTDSVVWSANYPSWFRFDGDYWVFLGHGVDNNTTYSAMSVSEGTTGTATTARSMRADRLKSIILGTKLTGLSTSTTGAVAATDTVLVGMGKLQATKADKSAIPTVNNATLTIQKNGTNVATFTANASSNVTANISVPTKVSDLTNDSGFITGITSSDVTTALGYTPYNSSNPSNYQTATQVANSIATETTNRESADNNLQSQIDAIVSSSDVFDIVGTYAELQAYDITTVPVNDIIKVLVDSTHSGAATYYRCVETGGVKSWSYIGSEGAYYTKGEADAAFVPQTRTINNKALSANITLTASDVGALPSSTVIPTVNNPTITITQGGVSKGSFTLNQATGDTIALDAGGGSSLTAGVGIDITNDVISVEGVKDQRNTSTAIKTWTGTKAQYDAITTKDNNMLYHITDDESDIYDRVSGVINRIYPIGSIYLTVSNDNPATLLGLGTWQKVASGRVLQGSDNDHAAGTTKEAGLPNITGAASNSNPSAVTCYNNQYTGAITYSTITGTRYYTGTNATAASDPAMGIGFDASLSNSIYGNSNTVQPPAFVVNIWQRVA